MREWFDNLAPRERLLVSAAGALAVFALLVMAVLRPLSSGRADALEKIERQQSLLTDIERVASRYGPQRGGNAASRPAAGSDSLVLIVDRSTRERGMGAYLKRNQPDGAATIRLRFENVPFDTYVEWLAEMQNTHGLDAVTANIDPAPEPGRVNSNLVLSRGG